MRFVGSFWSEHIAAIEAEAAAQERARLTPTPGQRLILIAEGLLELFGGRTDDGRAITAEWGRPDDHGWYTPTSSATDDGWLERQRAEAAAQERARLRRGLYELSTLDLPTGVYVDLDAVHNLLLDPVP